MSSEHSDDAAPPKADGSDFLGRFREIVSDPLNLLVERHPLAGTVEDGLVVLLNGNRAPLQGKASYYGDFSNILVINRGVHEPLEEFAFQELLRRLPEAPTMLELGAYWGHYSMWLKRMRPAASVCLVEPEARNLAAGSQNFTRNGLQGEFIQAFVGAGQFEVDTYMAARSLVRLDILHADIQGYELEMLDGTATALTERRIDYLFVSTHGGRLHRQVHSRLKASGYRVEISSDHDDETTAGDGFIFASSPKVQPVFEGFQPMGRRQICLATPDELVAYVTSLEQYRRGNADFRPGDFKALHSND